MFLEVESNRHYPSKLKITRVYEITGEKNSMILSCTIDQINEWRDGALVQNAFPQLNPDEREFLITGMTPDIWEREMGEEE